MVDTQKLFDLSGKTVILTGAAGYLGQGYAEAFSQAHANVVLADKEFSKCKEISKELEKKYKNQTLPIKIELTNKQSIKNMVAKTIKKFSNIDILVNNAIFPEGVKERSIPFEEFPLSIWNQVISVNTTGMFLCCQEVGKKMVKQNNGVIVNVSSIYGLQAADQRIYSESGLNSTVVYAVTKSAVLNFSRYLASYWHDKGIRVNSLTLGGVENNQDSKFKKKYAAKTMLGRMAKKDEYVGAMLFLVSDASSYMTGSNVVVDGGWTVW